MKESLFSFKDYKLYLRTWIGAQPHRGRGVKAALALSAQCNTTYISQVLNGTPHFSLEQAERISTYLGHRTEEAIFFQLLVQLGRAGTPSLKNLIGSQITEILERRDNLKNRLDYKKTLEVADQLTYYSAWYYSAIHVVLTVAELQTVKALAEHFLLPPSRVIAVLEFLVNAGLAVEQAGRFTTGPVSLHLPKDSPAILSHHTNWRMQAISNLPKQKAPDLHYSSVVGIALKDAPIIRSIMIEAIEEIRAIVKDSKEDTAFYYGIDFFEC